LNAVIDANLLIALAANDPRADAVQTHLREHRSIALHAPDLLRYEVANGLTRAAAQGQLPVDRLARAWTRISNIPVTLHRLDDVPATIGIALELGRHSAYDASYLALATELDAELWTLDGPLHRNATSHGYRVRLIGG